MFAVAVALALSAALGGARESCAGDVCMGAKGDLFSQDRNGYTIDSSGEEKTLRTKLNDCNPLIQPDAALYRGLIDDEDMVHWKFIENIKSSCDFRHLMSLSTDFEKETTYLIAIGGTRKGFSAEVDGKKANGMELILEEAISSSPSLYFSEDMKLYICIPSPPPSAENVPNSNEETPESSKVAHNNTHLSDMSIARRTILPSLMTFHPTRVDRVAGVQTDEEAADDDEETEEAPLPTKGAPFDRDVSGFIGGGEGGCSLAGGSAANPIALLLMGTALLPLVWGRFSRGRIARKNVPVLMLGVLCALALASCGGAVDGVGTGPMDTGLEDGGEVSCKGLFCIAEIPDDDNENRDEETAEGPAVERDETTEVIVGVKNQIKLDEVKCNHKYSESISVSGGSGKYSMDVTGLPEGLEAETAWKGIRVSGKVFGGGCVPPGSEGWDVAITVCDEKDPSNCDRKTVPMTVRVEPVEIDMDDIKSGISVSVGAEKTVSLKASGGTGAEMSWSASEQSDQSILNKLFVDGQALRVTSDHAGQTTILVKACDGAIGDLCDQGEVVLRTTEQGVDIDEKKIELVAQVCGMNGTTVDSNTCRSFEGGIIPYGSVVHIELKNATSTSYRWEGTDGVCLKAVGGQDGTCASPLDLNGNAVLVEPSRLENKGKDLGNVVISATNPAGEKFELTLKSLQFQPPPCSREPKINISWMIGDKPSSTSVGIASAGTVKIKLNEVPVDGIDFELGVQDRDDVDGFIWEYCSIPRFEDGKGGASEEEGPLWKKCQDGASQSEPEEWKYVVRRDKADRAVEFSNTIRKSFVYPRKLIEEGLTKKGVSLSKVSSVQPKKLPVLFDHTFIRLTDEECDNRQSVHEVKFEITLPTPDEERFTGETIATVDYRPGTGSGGDDGDQARFQIWGDEGVLCFENNFQSHCEGEFFSVVVPRANGMQCDTISDLKTLRTNMNDEGGGGCSDSSSTAFTVTVRSVKIWGRVWMMSFNMGDQWYCSEYGTKGDAFGDDNNLRGRTYFYTLKPEASFLGSPKVFPEKQ